MKKKAPIALLIALMIAAVAGVAIMSFARSAPESHGDVFDRTGLGYRDNLKICVDSIGGADAGLLGSQPTPSSEITPLLAQPSATPDFMNYAVEQAQNALAFAIAQAPSDAYNLVAKYSNPTISVGCPTPRFGPGNSEGYEGRTAMRGTLTLGGPYGPSEMSEDRLRIYYLDPSDYEIAFPGESYAPSDDEWLCQSLCDPVTSSLYVPSDVGAETLGKGVAEMLYLLSREDIQELSHQRLDKPEFR